MVNAMKKFQPRPCSRCETLFQPTSPADRHCSSFCAVLARTDLNGAGGCWLWQGYINPAGYGRLAIRGRMYLAHRATWEHRNGNVPHGLFVLHKCDVRNCVNPDHLFVGTMHENTQDMMAKGRHRPVFGERSHHSKLKESDVREIIDAPKGSHHALAAKFNVSPSTILNIRAGRKWRRVTEEWRQHQ